MHRYAREAENRLEMILFWDHEPAYPFSSSTAFGCAIDIRLCFVQPASRCYSTALSAVFREKFDYLFLLSSLSAQLVKRTCDTSRYHPSHCAWTDYMSGSYADYLCSYKCMPTASTNALIHQYGETRRRQHIPSRRRADVAVWTVEKSSEPEKAIQQAQPNIALFSETRCAKQEPRL